MSDGDESRDLAACAAFTAETSAAGGLIGDLVRAFFSFLGRADIDEDRECGSGMALCFMVTATGTATATATGTAGAVAGSGEMDDSVGTSCC